MLRISIMTIMESAIISNLLLLIISLILSNRKIFLKIDLRIIFFLLQVTIIRCLIPFEFPFSKNLILPEWISKPITYIRHPYFINNTLSVESILGIIWITGFIVNTLKDVIVWQRFKKYIDDYSEDVTERYKNILKEIAQNDKINYKILVVPNIQTPMIFSQINPKIIIPKSCDLSERELRYVLTHEIMHHKNHDLILKSILKMVCNIYWWNPLCKILEKEIDVLMEIKVDKDVTSIEDICKIEYVGCILTIAKNNLDNINVLPVIPFCNKSGSLFSLRIDKLFNDNEKVNKQLFYITMLFTIVLFVSSYFVTLENAYTSKKVSLETEGNTIDNTRIYLNDDGTYDIYFYGEFLERTDDLKYYPDNIQIMRREY